MSFISFINQLREAFPQFTWTCDPKYGMTYFGHINVKPVHRRNPVTKAREVTGNVSIYISSEMRKGKRDSFHYATCCQRINTVDYRCKNEYIREHGKIFVSGKKLDVILKKLKKEVDMNMFSLNTGK